MQIALETADRVFSKWGLEMRFRKTKVMAVDCDVVPSHFYIEHGSIETFSCLKFLGSYLAKDGGIGLGFTHRIKAAASAFLKLEAFWKNRHVQEAVKYNMYQAMVQANLLYAYETWATGPGPVAWRLSPLLRFSKSDTSSLRHHLTMPQEDI